MRDFRKTPIEGGEGLVGKTVVRVRPGARGEGRETRKLTFIFDNGASLVVDGGFPACSHMVSPEGTLPDLEGRRFDGIECRRFDARKGRGGRDEARLALTVVADGNEFILRWEAAVHEDFDVGPEPVIHVRAPLLSDLQAV